MGISLKDLGSFATGAIERDRELTSEKFKIRAEELKANRDFVIAQKQKKYESEIKSFEDEQKKYKAIQSVNAKYEGQDNVNKAAWGKAYLFEYKPEQYNAIVKQADGDIEYMNSLFSEQASKNLVNYKTSTTRDAIDDNIRNEVESITADYNNRLENAKGDSFLISKLIGDKNKKIAKVTKEVTEGAKGVEISKSITEETQPVKTSESKMPFTFAEESTVATFKPPKKFRDEIKPVRAKLNDNDSQDVYSKSAVNATLSLFSKADIAKPKVFYKKNQQTNQVEGFEGAGAVLNEHLGELWGGATDGFTNEKIYLETGKESSYIPSVFNTSTVKNKIKSRVNDYTYIEQPKTWFKDRESIVGIVPWSVVDINDTIGNLTFNSKADKKLTGEVYVKALRLYSDKYNKTAEKIVNGEIIPATIIESNQKFINDLQTELLGLRGGSNSKSQEIQAMMLTMLTPKKTSTDNKVSTGKIIIEASPGKTKEVDDTEENRNLAESKGFKIIESKINKLKDTSTQIEGDVDEEYTEGTEFDVVSKKPVASMDFEERRAYEKEKSDERKRKREERNKSFNEKIRKNNEQFKNNKSLTSVKANIPDVDEDA